jgi:hypothetical protein
LNALRFGYPSIAELENKQVVLVFWGTKTSQTAIHWMRFDPDSIPALIPGQDTRGS